MADLTLSGNEITDVLRTAALEGDGRPSPDGSIGVWEATVNHCTNGGFEIDTLGWFPFQAMLTRHVDAALFGGFGMKIDRDGASGEARYATGATMTPGAAACYSFFARFADGEPVTNLSVQARWADDINNTVGNFDAIIDVGGGWYRLIKTGLVVQDPEALLQCGVRNLRDPAVTLYVDGMNVEEKPVPTPYVRTNGPIASRSAARVRIPASVLDETQGWIAFRVRVGADPAILAASMSLLTWLDSGDEIVDLYLTGADPAVLTMRRLTGGAGAAEGQQSASLSAGDLITVIGTWSALALGASLNGAAFTMTPNISIPTLAIALADLGSFGNGTSHINSDILWFACGKGKITDAQAAALHAQGNSDPFEWELFPDAMHPTLLWKADTAAYLTFGPRAYAQGGRHHDDYA